MEVNTIKRQYQFMKIPTFGIVNFRHYYGYPVFSIAFAWGFWGISFKFGARKAEV